MQHSFLDPKNYVVKCSIVFFLQKAKSKMHDLIKR